MALLQQCFSFKGRITKRAFRRHLFGVVIFLVVSHILVGAVYVLRPILVPVCIVVYYTMIPVGVKRLHDLNHPGWLILTGLVPITVGIFLDSILGTIIIFIGSFILAPYLSLAEGTPGDNNYGVSPRDKI